MKTLIILVTALGLAACGASDEKGSNSGAPDAAATPVVSAEKQGAAIVDPFEGHFKGVCKSSDRATIEVENEAFQSSIWVVDCFSGARTSLDPSVVRQYKIVSDLGSGSYTVEISVPAKGSASGQVNWVVTPYGLQMNEKIAKLRDYELTRVD